MTVKSEDLYDGLAEIYSGKFDRLSEAQIRTRTEFVKYVKTACPHSPRILDIGCGTGRDMKFFESLGSRASGIDASGKMLEVATQKGLKSLYFGDFLTYCFPANGFDGIWCLSMLQDLPTVEKVQAAVRKIAEILRPGGYLFVVTPRFVDQPNGSIVVHRSEYGCMEALVNMTARQLKGMLVESGFEIIAERSQCNQRTESSEAKEYLEFVCMRRD